jgi:histidinol-phosphate/aromatic aminotransferase/cobyric acid decarboxylase-like protein
LIDRVFHGGNVWQGEDPSDWLDYSANIRPGRTMGWIADAVNAAKKAMRYYPQPDMSRARKGLAAYLDLPEDFVQPASGGASAIVLATACGMERVLLCSPCFGEYRAAAVNRGLPVESACLLESGRRIADPAKAVRSVLKEGTLVWICNPMNPVGHAFSRDQILDLLTLAQQRRCRVALDEAFIDFCPEYSCRDLVKEWPELIVTGSLTKILGIPGIRLGYLCSRDALQLGQKALPWELNCFAEAIARELPFHREEIAEEARRNEGRRRPFTEGLRSLGLFVYPSASNFVLVDLGRDASPIVSMLKEKRILVRTCLDFEGLADGRHLRLAVKDDRSNRRLLRALKESLSCAENR